MHSFCDDSSMRGVCSWPVLLHINACCTIFRASRKRSNVSSTMLRRSYGYRADCKFVIPDGNRMTLEPRALRFQNCCGNVVTTKNDISNMIARCSAIELHPSRSLRGLNILYVSRKIYYCILFVFYETIKWIFAPIFKIIKLFFLFDYFRLISFIS